MCHEVGAWDLADCIRILEIAVFILPVSNFLETLGEQRINLLTSFLGQLRIGVWPRHGLSGMLLNSAGRAAQ